MKERRPIMIEKERNKQVKFLVFFFFFRERERDKRTPRLMIMINEKKYRRLSLVVAEPLGNKQKKQTHISVCAFTHI